METDNLEFNREKLLWRYKLLPYFNELSDEINEALLNIKTYLGKSILLRDVPSINFWIAELVKYIRLYNLKFSKQDHVTFIRVLYDLVTLSELDYFVIRQIANCMVILLGKERLLVPGKDLVLPWRPLFELFKKIYPRRHSTRPLPRIPDHLQEDIRDFVLCSRCYFPMSETKNILRECKQDLCPSDLKIMGYGIESLAFFLPITSQGKQADISYELWLTEFMDIWKATSNSCPWNDNMLLLISKLASYNIGYIDWEPYMSTIFSRILTSFNLPVKYKNYALGKVPNMALEYGSLWIVSVLGGGSSAQDCLDQLLKTIESYCKPVNSGVWIRGLKIFFTILSDDFVLRVKAETLRSSAWCNQIPDSHKLKDADITRFVKSLNDLAVQSMYNAMLAYDLVSLFRNLAFLKPDLVIPPILERLYLQLDSVTETYKLVAALTFTGAICRPLFDGAKSHAYEEGITHVMQLLFGILPCIDANDLTKSTSAFYVILMVTIMVPFVDVSAECTELNLSPEAELACSSTAQFEEFVLQFLDKCLMFIENSTSECTRLDRSSTEPAPSHQNGTLFYTVNFILERTSSSTFTAALKKVYNFAMSRVPENKTTVEQIAKLLATFSLANEKETLKLVVPSICNYIRDVVDSNPDIQKEEHLDNEFLYKLNILSQVVNCIGDALIPYLPQLTSVLECTLHLTCKVASSIACGMLKRMLESLFKLRARSVRRRPNDDRSSIFLTEWMNAGISIEDVEVDWYYPGINEICCIEQLVQKFLLPEMRLIDRYTNDQNFITRDELHQTLNVIDSILSSVYYLFAPWEDAPFDIYNMKTPAKFTKFRAGISDYIRMPDGRNISIVIAEKLLNLQCVILQHKEDDVTSLMCLIKIWNVMLPSTNMQYYRDRSINKHIKDALSNKLVKKDRHVAPILIYSSVNLHNIRILCNPFEFTETQEKIFRNLLTLCVNHYSRVRKKAQEVIVAVVKTTPFAAKLTVDSIVENLKINTEQEHDKFKGTLFLLTQLIRNLFLITRGYQSTKKLFPALVKAMPSEKVTIINLLEQLQERTIKLFSTKQHRYSIPDIVLSQAKTLWHTDNNVMPIICPQPSEKEIQDALREMNEENVKTVKDYEELLLNLLNVADQSNLHWRNKVLAMTLFNHLANDKDLYSDKHIQFFTQMLIHDSHPMRQVAIICTNTALHQYRRRFKKNLVDPFAIAGIEGATEYDDMKIGYREDNQWLLYKPENVPTNETEWNAQRYCHSSYIGYYRWPRELRLHAPSNEQESLDKPLSEMTPVEKVIHAFFSNDENIDKLITYYSMEQGKFDRGSFRAVHFTFFENLFRNYGDRYIQPFRERLSKLTTENRKSYQICAAEIIAGIICGSKYWPYDKIESLSTWLVPLIHAAFDCCSEETMNIWLSCFSLALYKCDVNKASYVIKALTDNPIRQDTTYKDVGRILTITVLSFHTWRLPYIFHHLLKCYKLHLSHPYKQIRDTLGTALAYLFGMGIKIEGWNNSQLPAVSEFMEEYILPRLDDLRKLDSLSADAASRNDIKNGSTVKGTSISTEVEIAADKKKDTINLLKTVCTWVVKAGHNTNFALPIEFYSLLPLLCSMANYEQDSELQDLCNIAISTLATSSVTTSFDLMHVLCAFHETSKSRLVYARLCCLEFLQTFVFYNLPFVSNEEAPRTEILHTVESLLEDDRVEVRTKTGQVISSLIHCGFIKEPKISLLPNFTRMSRTVYAGDKTNLYTRHAGVIGLCAMINASPYDVPDYIPEVFVRLSDNMTDPQPIPSTIRKTLDDFKRTHHSDWKMLQKKFTEEQLSVFDDMVIPPTYYA